MLDEQRPSVLDRASLSFLLSFFLSFGVPFTPLTLLSHVLEGIRQDPPILQPIPTDTQFVSFWSPVRPSQCGTEQVLLIKTSWGENVWLPFLHVERYLTYQTGEEKALTTAQSSWFAVLVVSQRKCYPPFHVFIGAYSKCNQDERGRIRIFYSYICICCQKELVHLGLLSCNSRSCSKSNHPTL